MTLAQLNCGYVPLVDGAPLIIAHALGFATDEGLHLNLLRQPSWAALRDLVALGHLDAAHMLAPMPIAMTMGLSGMTTRIDALMVLSVNGNVIGVSGTLADAMRGAGWQGQFNDPVASANALRKAAARPLRVGVPFPFSMHRLLFDYWLRDSLPYSIVTTPPPLMAEAVATGDLDVFCVGAPWGAVAVESGAAELILPGRAIWAFAPEKVLAARHDWVTQNPDMSGALMRCVYKAALWLDTSQNHALASEILARSEHLDLPEKTIYDALSGSVTPSLSAEPLDVPGFLQFHRKAANFPWRSQAAWIGARIALHHQLDPCATVRTAQSCFRPDLYRQKLTSVGADMPGASAKLEGAMMHGTAVASTRGDMILGPDAFFDGAIFDFDDPK
ncbi:MAG: ABC transporter substrate-binding protein [Rhodobacter sp.]|nr:ABC transporter substrate-binding protein [Rhodobacter sp.]